MNISGIFALDMIANVGFLFYVINMNFAMISLHLLPAYNIADLKADQKLKERLVIVVLFSFKVLRGRIHEILSPLPIFIKVHASFFCVNKVNVPFHTKYCDGSIVSVLLSIYSLERKSLH